jgi:aspartate racemase
MQHGVHLAESASPIPWLTMTELVAKAVAQDSRKVVGLIGTKMVMFGSTYQTALGLKGIQVLIPGEVDVEGLNTIIFRELVYGVVRKESQSRVMEVVRGLSAQGCEAVVLGCSEAPLLINQENSPLPVYDATDLLAEGAVRYAIGALA